MLLMMSCILPVIICTNLTVLDCRAGRQRLREFWLDGAALRRRTYNLKYGKEFWRKLGSIWTLLCMFWHCTSSSMRVACDRSVPRRARTDLHASAPGFCLADTFALRRWHVLSQARQQHGQDTWPSTCPCWLKWKAINWEGKWVGFAFARRGGNKQLQL